MSLNLIFENRNQFYSDLKPFKTSTEVTFVTTLSTATYDDYTTFNQTVDQPELFTVTPGNI